MVEVIRNRVEAMKGMKSQTFGVEVEMNEITRRKAAGIVAKYFGTTAWNSAEVYGYKSWACKDTKGRVWKFERDVSITGDDLHKCEMVTPILTYDEDVNDLQEIIRLLRKAGAQSSPSRGCGVHIHIGAAGHTPRTLRNLANIMASKESSIVAALKIDPFRVSRYCQKINQGFVERINREKPDTMEKLADCWYEGNHCNYGRNQHYNYSRYHILNYHATFTKGTVEFRVFQFNDPEGDKKNGLNAGELRAYILFCLAVSHLAKLVKRASPKVRCPEKELAKKRMVDWLYNELGMYGEEFAIVREVFSRNLPNDPMTEAA